MWFTYDPEDGFVEHNTEDEAKQYAQGLLDEWREYAERNGGWPYEVDHLCWGKIHGETEARCSVDENDLIERTEYRLTSPD